MGLENCLASPRTGTTGYIGSDALHVLAHTHPEYEITALVRNRDKGAKVAPQYPSIRLVYGDLDSATLLTEEAAKADIVCHWANADHEAGANALITELTKQQDARPSYLIHTSGMRILKVADMGREAYGVRTEKVFDDWYGVKEVTSLPDAAPHCNVDKIVLTAGTEQGARAKTAIVCPPTIYGPGRGPGN